MFPDQTAIELIVYGMNRMGSHGLTRGSPRTFELAVGGYRGSSLSRSSRLVTLQDWADAVGLLLVPWPYNGPVRKVELKKVLNVIDDGGEDAWRRRSRERRAHIGHRMEKPWEVPTNERRCDRKNRMINILN